MSFPRYPKYKDSGVEWLGEVPEHWEILSLGVCPDTCHQKAMDWVQKGFFSACGLL